MKKTYSVLIIEDDFRVAEINRQYVEKVAGFDVQKVVKSGNEALQYLENCQNMPDLLLLDLYIPDVEGLELFWQIRHEYQEVDMVVVSAEKDTSAIQETLRGGIFDFIVKPVDDARFAQTLYRYKKYRNYMQSKKELEQADIDYLTGFRRLLDSHSPDRQLPKGIDSITLGKINQLLNDKMAAGVGVTAVELSKLLGISRSTARRYLEYLVSIKKVKTKLNYGTVGRPERQYTRCEAYEQNYQNDNYLFYE
ncbi:response regulator [Siminovitchia sp. FSL H7-0308]|uniref:response regulator n=1 Tax=Siminovitchia sp. FSL H7-0308 TaxID=2921432 RepID=UPI0030EC9037